MCINDDERNELYWNTLKEAILDRYKDEVNKVIKHSAGNFNNIYMEYTQDEIMEANKIFEADIFVSFNNFEQEEIFNIYTM